VYCAPSSAGTGAGAGAASVAAAKKVMKIVESCMLEFVERGRYRCFCEFVLCD
jgi:hypothetical protein